MKILLVDDEPLSRNATAEFLEEQLAHEVIQCENGQEAKKILENESFSLVISDIRMPKVDGLELLKFVKSTPTLTDVDMILITGHGDIDTAIKALRYGAYDFILKPIDIEELAAAVTRSMERQALIIENSELKQKFEKKSKITAKSKKHSYYSATLQSEIELPVNGIDLKILEAEIIDYVLDMHKNNKTQTAKFLGITVASLLKHIKKKNPGNTK